MNPTVKPGESLQRLVRALEQATNNAANVTVESPKRLPDKDTGQLREHDVVLTFSLSHHSIVMALECRDRSRPVGVPDVEAFRSKCDRTGIDKGIIVSSRGFGKKALKKAEAMEIGCLSLDETERFNWCQAPGVEFTERDLLDDGPPWEYGTAAPFRGSSQLYDSQGNALAAAHFSNIAQAALSQRPPEVAAREDAEAVSTPVTCTFDNAGASAFHLIDESGAKVPLTRMVLHVKYKVRHVVIPFKFRQYIDHAGGRQLYTAAFASIEGANLDGDLVLHHDGTAARVTFIPRSG
jgi:hypothetical protein